MDPTTRREYDDELAQQAPLVPDLGRTDDRRTMADGSGLPTDPTIQRTYDDELAQEAPLVPDLSRPNSDGLDTAGGR